ncbi:MAG: beta-galactosidase [Terriglobia bacterium]
MQPEFLGLDDLKKPRALQGADLFVLPYGSAFPADVWKAIEEYLESGGNLLTLGGRPLFVPVFEESGKFVAGRPQNSYSRLLGIWHTYEVPQKEREEFRWDDNYDFLPRVAIRARRVFVAGAWWDSGDYAGMGHILNSNGDPVAAPVVREDYRTPHGGEKPSLLGARVVTLNFDPEPAYWSSADGRALIQAAAEYASQGATFLRLELAYASLHPGESSQVTVQVRSVRNQQQGVPLRGTVRVELFSQGSIVETAQVACSGETTQGSVTFRRPLLPGLYRVRAAYEEDGKTRETYQTGFWVRDDQLLKTGARLEVGRDYFRRNGAPFAPVGTNYFTTDEFYTGFLGSSNAYVWERDFADMEKHGVTFVRTGVWSNHADYLDKVTGGVEERILRSLEAFLLSASRHNIQVNFTFFAFDPQTIRRFPGEEPLQFGPGTNPYTDPLARRAQKNYVVSIVSRFKDVPNLSWDLINEPSFSNPRHLWRGNTPNADPTEVKAWNDWLRQRYGEIRRLGEAWSVPPEGLKDFGAIGLPDREDLSLSRYGSARNVRAIDYNLFAQDMFSEWAEDLIAAIRSTGSRQLVTVGQDEGGVSDRILNQFYGASGVAFTVNHTWWRDDALLWDSVAAKRPGMPNLIGETGIQPVWNMDGSWRWDEVQGLGLFERKLALGFAAANGGSLQWDWATGDAFGIKRADGSNKLWLDVLAGIGDFARHAAPYLTEERTPEVAIVLPQSLQLSVFNSAAIEAQQKCVRALYHYARASAYVVGEYQIELLGDPKLIILPSPWVLNQRAWDIILAKVRTGATLLVSGRFDADEHFHPTSRQHEVGIDYVAGPLATRENPIEWPDGKSVLTYSGEKTTHLERGFLDSERSFVETSVGNGRILYFPLPLELNDNLQAVGDVYRFALKRAQVKPVYSTEVQDAGILICPTQLPEATLYVLTSETSSSSSVSFVDSASSKKLNGSLQPGRAALLLVSKRGEILARYNWAPDK